MKNVCFTGHRKINATRELKEKLMATIEALIQEGATDFYSGGCCGWDMLCSCAVIVMRRKYPQIKLHLILPCPNEEQTAKWRASQKEWFYKILAAADSVEYTSGHYTSDCMRIRNARLAELADYCICYYSGAYSSGTGQTLRMAERRGAIFYNMAQLD